LLLIPAGATSRRCSRPGALPALQCLWPRRADRCDLRAGRLPSRRRGRGRRHDRTCRSRPSTLADPRARSATPAPAATRANSATAVDPARHTATGPPPEMVPESAGRKTQSRFSPALSEHTRAREGVLFLPTGPSERRMAVWCWRAAPWAISKAGDVGAANQREQDPVGEGFSADI
jgi:hypothetical protein